MRILFVLGGFRVGGYEILSVRLANSLAQRHNQIAILSLSGDRQILDKVNKRVATYGVARKYKYDFAVLTKTLRVLMDFNPDLVVSCAFFEHFMIRVAASLYPCKTKFILSFHTTEPFDSKERHWNKLYGAMTKFFNDHYVAIHNSQIFYYSTEYGLPAGRFTLIHNGVDTDYFAPVDRDLARRDGFLRIAHVASLKPLKDQWTLLKSVAEFDKYHSKWELKIAGADQLGMLNQYREYLKEHNIASKVRFFGSVNDIRDVLKDSDVFVLTSITEALPLSVIEAMAMGLPCIVTDVGGNSDIIEDGKEGFLVKPRDYRSVAKHLRFLISNPSKEKEMSIAVREKAVKRFDFEVMINKYCDLFESLLNNR